MSRKPILSTLILIIITSLITNSCTKENYMSDAVITGYDLRLCVCCGGLIIKIDNQSKTYLIGNDPAGLNIKNNESFPIKVKIDWQIDTLHCYGNYITITRLKRLQ